MRPSLLAAVVGLAQTGPGAGDPAGHLGLGRRATPGEGLPPRLGTVPEVAAPVALVGGRGTPATAKPVRTIGSDRPYATTLFDDIRRAMPFDAPQSLTPDEASAVSADLLHRARHPARGGRTRCRIAGPRGHAEPGRVHCRSLPRPALPTAR